MAEYIKVTISGTFPKEDIDLIADFYGGQDAEDKLQFATQLAQRVLANFLKAPSQSKLEKELLEQKEAAVSLLEERVESALTSNTEEVTS